MVAFLNFLLIFSIILQHGFTSLASRTEAVSIAEQLGYGVKRAVYYLNTLLEKCDNVEDLNRWILFMDSYLTCDARSYPQKLKSSMGTEDSLERLSVLCEAWPRKRRCSVRLSSKLNDCLGSQLEDGRAGTNALSLADAHMKFICHHKNEYISNLKDTSIDDLVPIEKRPLSCYAEIKESLMTCIAEGGLLDRPTTFCQNFNLANDCLEISSMKSCKNLQARDFLQRMLRQLQQNLKCASTNEIVGA